MSKVYQFYCNTEQKFIKVYSLTSPVSCPNDFTHAIELNTVKSMSKIDPPITIKQQRIENGNDNYKVETRSFLITGNTTGTQIYSWPIDINVLTVNFATNLDQKGDIVNSYIAPNTTIGVISSNVSAGNTTFNVQPSVLNYLQTGYLATITNGTTSNSLGMVTNIDTTNLRITTENTCSNSFVSGNYIQMTINNICNFEIGEPCLYELGKKNILSSHVPKNTPIKITYQNNSSVTKKFIFHVEYSY